MHFSVRKTALGAPPKSTCSNLSNRARLINPLGWNILTLSVILLSLNYRRVSSYV
jgi:hypothetical protein